MAAKKGFSERAWDEIINADMDGTWIDGTIEVARKRPDDPFADTGPLLEAMLKKGVTKEQISRLARALRYETVFQTVQLAADEELDGEQLDGVHEELLMADPSGKDGRPGSWPIVESPPPKAKKGTGKTAAAAPAKSAKKPLVDPNAPRLTLPKADDFVFSPDGSRLWLAHTSVNSSTVRGLSLPGGAQFAEFNALPNLRGIVCSPDGKRLATSNHYGIVASYDVATGKELWKSAKTNEETHNLLYAPDGSMILNSGSESCVRRRDAKTGKDLPSLEFGEGWLASEMACSPDGKELAVLASGDKGTFITYWDWRAGKELRRKRHPESGMTSGLAFLPTGRRLVTIAYDSIDVWDVKDHKRVSGFKVKEGVKGASLFPGGRLIAVNTYKEGAQVREFPSGTILKQLDTKDRYPTHWAFSPDGRHALLVASPKSFLWDVEALLVSR